MDASLTIDKTKTVPLEYSWDVGVPNSKSSVDCLTSIEGGVIKVTGYAPTVFVSLETNFLSSTHQTIAFEKQINFGDYYNSEDNIQTSSTSGSTVFCHNFIMPGKYEISLKNTEYSAIPDSYEDDPLNPKTYIEEGITYGKRQPFSWMWYNFYCNETTDQREEFFASFEPRREKMTWDDCKFQEKKAVTWNEISNDAIETRRKSAAWNWKFVKEKSTEFLNQKVKWYHTYKNGVVSRTWKDVSTKDCFDWKWKYKKLSNLQENAILTTSCRNWLSLSSTEQKPVRWREKSALMCVERTPFLESTVSEKKQALFVEVHEIPPTCYIEACEFAYFLNRHFYEDVIENIKIEEIQENSFDEDIFYFNSEQGPGRKVQMLIKEGEKEKMKVTFNSSRLDLDFGYKRTNDNTMYYGRFVEGVFDIKKELQYILPFKMSPYTVRLSPRKIRAGSFPIEKIIWDFGDNSPILIQQRRDLKTHSPFVYTGEFLLDANDPRNYDVHHTYIRNSKTGNCFYPSITAIASSTSTFDCASTVIGSLQLPVYVPGNTKILQTNLIYNETSEKIEPIYLGMVDGEAAAWRRSN